MSIFYMQKIGAVPAEAMERFCRQIEMPEEMSMRVLNCNKAWSCVFDEQLNQDLFDEERWDAAQEKVQEILGEDPDGVKILTLQLQCAVKAHDTYVQKNIPEEIYKATYKCYSRFVREHMVSYGCYGFDRYRWTLRQMAMKLFRIDELEYQLSHRDGQPVLRLHIPSDVDLTVAHVREATAHARRFMKEYAPEYADAKITCESWLLSPELGKLLPEASKIRKFQECFTMTGFEPEEMAYMEWLYQDRTYTLDDLDRLPQRTSLQRLVREHLKNGGVIGEGAGILRV